MNARFLLDTGASKCSIPIEVNNQILKLPIQRTDKGIQIAGGSADYDVVILEKMEVIRTKLYVEKVETWLSDDFILEMNFLSKFRFRISEGRKLTIES